MLQSQLTYGGDAAAVCVSVAHASRVLHPDWRTLPHVRLCARMLLTKAAERLRRAGYYANKLWLWLDGKDDGWFGERVLHHVNDEQACQAQLASMWDEVEAQAPPRIKFVRVGVTLLDLSPADARQLDFFIADDAARIRWEKLTGAMDRLNRKYGKRVIRMGDWETVPGGYFGGKIAYTRIPKGEDFW